MSSPTWLQARTKNQGGLKERGRSRHRDVQEEQEVQEVIVHPLEDSHQEDPYILTPAIRRIWDKASEENGDIEEEAEGIGRRQGHGEQNEVEVNL